MSGVNKVSDPYSNTEEQIERFAKIVGRGKRQDIFAAIYHHKAKIKSADEIVKKTKLRRIRVLQEARFLVRRGAAGPAKKDNGTAYEMDEWVHAHKNEILKYARNPKKLKNLPTKRKVVIQHVSAPRTFRPKVLELTIDDIDSFKLVKKFKPAGYLEGELSEKCFKRGVQRILNEPAEWKDWGGEMYDVATTRVVYKSKRISSVFALKGPGEKGVLVPAKMGKNGDQIDRMFMANTRLFVVQYVRQISPSIWELMKKLAREKSQANQETIYYMVVDGADSRRLVNGYPAKFAAPKKKAKKLSKKK